MIIYRRADKSDIDQIRDFINNHWEKNHIMAKDRALFEWQHVHDDEVDYMLALDDATNEIIATMGLIRYNSSRTPDYATVMICACKVDGEDFVGENLMSYFKNNIPQRYIVSVGVNRRYAKAIQYLEPGSIGVLEQYYLLNDSKSTYYIAKIVQPVNQMTYQKPEQLKRITEENEIRTILSSIELKKQVPYRDEDYIIHRYFHHPYYQYQIYLIGHKENDFIVVLREIMVNGIKIARVVDYLGDDNHVVELANALNYLMKEKDYEYIDFYEYGISDDLMKKAGFANVVDTPENIIPNYFEPFVQKNSKLYFYTTVNDQLKIYKNFGDQDRPRQWKGWQ